MANRCLINNRIFMLLAFGVIVLSFLGIFANYIFQRFTIQYNAERYVSKYIEDFDYNIKNEAHILNSFFHLMNKENLAKSYLSLNREELYNVTKSLFDSLNRYNYITHFYFIKPNDEVFLRVHDFNKHSDLITRFTYKKAKELQDDYYGLELGIKNTLTLRYVHPWIINNELVGYIELGKEIDKITDTISRKMDLEVFFTINKNEITNSSQSDKNYIIYETTNINDKIADFIDSSNTMKALNFNNKNYIAFKYPLQDATDKIIGTKIILVNVTNEYSELTKQSINYGILMSIATMLILIIGYIFSKFKQERMNEAIRNLEESKNQIELLMSQQEDLLELFNIGNSVLFIWNNDKKRTINYVTNNVKDLLDFTKEDFLTQKIKYDECIFPKDLNTVQKALSKALSKDEASFKHQPYRIVNRKGEAKWVLDYTVLSKDLNGNVTHFLSYIVDITEQKMVHENLKKLIDLQNNIIILTNGNELNYANKQFIKFFKYPSLEDFKKEHKCICKFFIEDHRYFHLKKIEENQNWIIEIQKLPENKCIVAMEDKYSIIHVFSVHINNFEKDLCIISFTDISETMIEQEKLEKKVNLDKLTNAFNREYFDNNIETILNNNSKIHLETAIVIFDIDCFKKVNDNFGHDIGDEVLKDFVNILKSNSRFSDDILIRWGGEEFLMILPIKDKDALFKVLEKYRLAIENHPFDVVGKITCSIGASIHNSSLEIKSTIKEADMALYEAKNSGRNQIKVND